jgi:hypothetical protein
VRIPAIVDSSGESAADAAVSARVSTLNYGDADFAIVAAGFQCPRLISGSGVAVSMRQFSLRSTCLPFKHAAHRRPFRDAIVALSANTPPSRP